MFDALKRLARGLIDRVDESTLEPLIKDYHDAVSALEGRIAAMEAKVGIAPPDTPHAPTS